MSITIDNFSNNFQHVADDLKEKIIRFYVYNDTIVDKNSSTTDSQNISKNVLFITEDHNVYAFGGNTRGCLGVRPFVSTPTPQLINDICKKQVINFYNGTHHMLAQTSNNEIYSWGYNKFGQLGVDPSSTDSLTPQRNKILSGKFIETMCCGDEHSLALSKTGDVYSWGNNKNGQVGIGRAVKFISRPTNLSLQDAFYGVKIDAISCGTDHSMVLTKNKTVFSWGSNDFGQLGHGDLKERNSPCPLSLKNVIKISCGQKSSMVITENGFLYIFGRSYLDGTNIKQVTPITFTNAITFKDVASYIYFDIFVGLSTNGFCYEFGKIESDTLKRPNKREETSLLEYYADIHKITLIAIEIKKINEKVIEEEKPTSNAGPTSNSNTESAAKSSEQTERPSEKKYVNQYTFLYEEIKLLGSGSFGSVFEAKRKSDGVTLAIKKIDLTGRTNYEAKMFLNEMMLSNDLDNDYIVKTYEPWYEKNTIYIPMEVCYDTLDTIIREKPKQLFNRKAASDTDCGQIMSLTEFFITSELFKEILNGVNYLHKRDHMHRDLKPPNIFISSGENGKFVKIGDFGLAKCLNIQGELVKSHTKMMVGTVKYTAPEVLKNRSDYGLMRDIYSLGVIAEDLYEIVNPPEMVEGSLLSEKYNCIIDIKDEMISQNPKKRPTCDLLLSKSDEWCINYDDLKNDNQFKSFKDKIISTNNIQTGFNLYFLKKKLF